MVRALACGLGAVMLAAAAPVHAQDAQPLFQSDELVSLTLNGPLRAIARDKKKDQQQWQPGTLSYSDLQGQAVTLDVELKARGNYRRKECRYPPLRVRFDKDQANGTLFEGQRRLKLVAPCEGSKRYEEYVVEEYLIYRMFNLLGDYSFRVRPLQVRFVDAKGKERESYGFFIEDEKRMAARYKRKVADWDGASFSMMNPEALAMYELFQFLIAGHDWSVIAGPPGSACCHNTKLLTVDESEDDVIPVPYDFDFSGMIDTSYALPPESVPIRRVRQRYYRGRCTSPEILSQTLNRFRDQRAAITQLYSGYERLKPRTRKDAIRYIDDFYETIDDQDKLQRKIVGRCKKL